MKIYENWDSKLIETYHSPLTTFRVIFGEYFAPANDDVTFKNVHLKKNSLK